MSTTPDCASICAIKHKFMQNTNELCRQAHHKLNAQCVGALTDVSDAPNGLSGQQDIHLLIKTKMIESMSDKPKAQQNLRILFN